MRNLRFFFLLALMCVVGCFLYNWRFYGSFLGRPEPPGRESTYEVLRHCRLVPSAANDGDSFHFLYQGSKKVFRLYYVDAPETDMSFPDRVREQAAYFGHTKVAATLKAGRRAREFALNLLRRERFEIVTKWQPVFDSHRSYAFVRFPELPEDRRYLGEQLVKAGLVRIHTRGADLPGGRTWSQQRGYLRELESVARKQKRGAWGL